MYARTYVCAWSTYVRTYPLAYFKFVETCGMNAQLDTLAPLITRSNEPVHMYVQYVHTYISLEHMYTWHSFTSTHLY